MGSPSLDVMGDTAALLLRTTGLVFLPRDLRPAVTRRRGSKAWMPWRQTSRGGATRWTARSGRRCSRCPPRSWRLPAASSTTTVRRSGEPTGPSFHCSGTSPRACRTTPGSCTCSGCWAGCSSRRNSRASTAARRARCVRCRRAPTWSASGVTTEATTARVPSVTVACLRPSRSSSPRRSRPPSACMHWPSTG